MLFDDVALGSARSVTGSITRAGLSLLLVSALLGTGCSEMAQDGTGVASDIASENGFTLNGFTLNGFTLNGFTLNGLSANGFTLNGFTLNGLSTANGLSSTSGLMTTYGGRMAIKYMVKCAYPSGQNLVKTDQYGTAYTFAGSLGVAPEAINGPCDLDCQEKISACMLAHVNNSGQHISIWLVGPDPGIGWGASPDYPYQEGAFFGNIITTPWQGYYCAGKDMSSGEVPGRLGTPMASTVYVDPYGAGVACGAPGACMPQQQGYGPCNDSTPMAPYTTGHKWNHVVTVWRNFEQTQMYKICNVYSGKCLGVVGGSTSAGADVEQRTYSGAAGQTWQILQVSSGNYKIVNVYSGKVLDVSGSQMVQNTYSGASSQWFPIKYIKSQAGYANLVMSSDAKDGLYVPSSSDGALVQLNATLGSDSDKWTFMAVGPVSAAGSETVATTTTTPTGTNPCAAFCSNPTVFTTNNYQSGNLGTGAVCRETTANLSGTNISNSAGRTFTINGVAYSGDGNISALPPAVNGGYCFEASAGGLDYAAFATW